MFVPAFPKRRFIEAGVTTDKVALLEADYEARSGVEQSALSERWARVDGAGLREYADSQEFDVIADRATAEAEADGLAAGDLTVAQLKDELEQRGVEAPDGARKSDLVELVEASRLADTGGTAEVA